MSADWSAVPSASAFPAIGAVLQPQQQADDRTVSGIVFAHTAHPSTRTIGGAASGTGKNSTNSSSSSSRGGKSRHVSGAVVSSIGNDRGSSGVVEVVGGAGGDDDDTRGSDSTTQLDTNLARQGSNFGLPIALHLTILMHGGIGIIEVGLARLANILCLGDCWLEAAEHISSSSLRLFCLPFLSLSLCLFLHFRSLWSLPSCTIVRSTGSQSSWEEAVIPQILDDHPLVRAISTQGRKGMWMKHVKVAPSRTKPRLPPRPSQRRGPPSPRESYQCSTVPNRMTAT